VGRELGAEALSRDRNRRLLHPGAHAGVLRQHLVPQRSPRVPSAEARASERELHSAPLRRRRPPLRRSRPSSSRHGHAGARGAAVPRSARPFHAGLEVAGRQEGAVGAWSAARPCRHRPSARSRRHLATTALAGQADHPPPAPPRPTPTLPPEMPDAPASEEASRGVGKLDEDEVQAEPLASSEADGPVEHDLPSPPSSGESAVGRPSNHSRSIAIVVVFLATVLAAVFLVRPVQLPDVPPEVVTVEIDTRPGDPDGPPPPPPGSDTDGQVHAPAPDTRDSPEPPVPSPHVPQPEPPPGCGNGTLEPDEECDFGDANHEKVTTSGCSRFCTLPWATIEARAYPIGWPDKKLGSERDHEVVELSRFEILKTEVTRAQYARVGRWRRPGELDRRPQTGVPWKEAQSFCAKLGARLPRDAEWEVAARGGSFSRTVCEEQDCLLGRAWFRRNSDRRHHDVTLLHPNNWDLYDMHGNAWEWMDDCYPSGRPPCGQVVVRGGSYLTMEKFFVPSYRASFPPDTTDRPIGFRCVRGPGQTEPRRPSEGAATLQSGSPG